MKTYYFSIVLLLTMFGCAKTDSKINTAEGEELFITKAPGKACRTYEVFQEQLKADPTLKDRMNDIEAFTNRYIQNPAAYRKVINGVLELPVVVNVLYNKPEENISDRQIQSQLDVLNEDFGATNKDLFTTSTYNSVKSGDLKIRFILKQVNRKYTTVTAFSTNNAMKSASRGGIDATSPETTMNMWVCNLGGGILGYAQFPGGNKATDGVVINTLAFGRGAAYNLYTDYNLGRTATHEVGHYFNLRHIWGDRQCGNDYVDDTPLHYTYNFGCPPANKISSCDGGIEMTMNYIYIQTMPVCICFRRDKPCVYRQRMQLAARELHLRIKFCWYIKKCPDSNRAFSFIHYLILIDHICSKIRT